MANNCLLGRILSTTWHSTPNHCPQSRYFPRAPNSGTGSQPLAKVVVSPQGHFAGRCGSPVALLTSHLASPARTNLHAYRLAVQGHCFAHELPGKYLRGTPPGRVPHARLGPSAMLKTDTPKTPSTRRARAGTGTLTMAQRKVIALKPGPGNSSLKPSPKSRHFDPRVKM